ncbi:MAG: glycosyltransferase [Flavobacteriales bacterium]|jgi:teichuronic acid biosynthesis glycosyltransferase TuaC|nr:glycosyltransferase [Flavobacteriales bacterium]
MVEAVEDKPLRIMVVIPGRPEERTMVFSRRQARALAEMHNALVEVYFLESRTSPITMLKELRRMKETIRRFKPEVVHAHYGTVTALLSVLVSPVPVVITFHGSDLNHTPHDGFFRDLLGRLMSQSAALGATGIICVSEQLRDRLWWKRKRVRILPMGVELRRYIPVPRDEARRRLGWSARPQVVIFNATAPARKRLDIAQQVEHKLQAEGVSMELELLQGGITQEEMPVLLSAADALLMCSNSEGSPTMVKEAMACDLPVVTNDVGDVKDRLAGVSPGAVVSQDPTELSKALRSVLLEARRSNGRAMAVRNKADAESLDALTFELLLSCARGNG